MARLSPREREMMDQLVAGKSSKQIALDYGLSIKTVSIHRTHIMIKMGVESMTDLVRLVMENKQEPEPILPNQQDVDGLPIYGAAESTQKNQPKKGDDGGEGSKDGGGSKKLSKKGEELKEEMDSLVDEIDDVLEENAEEFVKNYVQRGGQ